MASEAAFYLPQERVRVSHTPQCRRAAAGACCEKRVEGRGEAASKHFLPPLSLQHTQAEQLISGLPKSLKSITYDFGATLKVQRARGEGRGGG